MCIYIYIFLYTDYLKNGYNHLSDDLNLKYFNFFLTLISVVVDKRGCEREREVKKAEK